MRKIKLILISLLCAAAALVLFQSVFLIGYVPSESMEPTLQKDSLILGLRTFETLKKGDIIIFERNDKLLVKRIAGMPNESIEVSEHIYNIPENCYFVLGDNDKNSFDSRYWSCPYVDKNNITAILIFPQYCKQKTEGV